MEINFSKLEKKILKYWKENKIFERSIEQNKKARNFVFYEGPPTANARPGLHHVLSRVFKDIICRYKTMQGFRVLRKAGWDTHGLPVELEIEKKLGLKSKKDIEKYGMAEFNKKCRESVWQYKKDWENLTERIAFWLDMENPYITYSSDYIETVWWILKKIYKKGLLYQDYKVVPYCPRCGTTLSSHEVALGYKKIKEPAIYLKFRILNPEFKDTSLLVWTTTPWTLIGNVAVALNPNFSYVKVKVDSSSQIWPDKTWEDKYLILAKERLEAIPFPGEIVQEFLGRDLINLYYQPPYPVESQKGITIYKTLPADFVSLGEGTGLVHIAPAFGLEDMELIKIKNEKLKMKNEPEFPILLTVNEEGKFKFDVKKWAGLFVKEADPLIIEDLRKRGLLLKEEWYEHDYPFCWRCRSLLLYYAKQNWFIKMEKMKKDLIKNNQKINWIPSHLKKGRFGEWLREVKDWALSRERYWGTPLPIWQCKKCPGSKAELAKGLTRSELGLTSGCGHLEFIGSLKDLLFQKFSKNTYFICRHGQSLRQIKKITMCWPEKIFCPLTKKGEEETKITAKKLKTKKIDLIFSSDLLRTKQTAEIISKEIKAKIIFDKRIREWNVGSFNGKEPQLVWEYLNKKQNFLVARPPKGESLAMIRKRMYQFLKEINEKYQEKNILIISHGLPLTILEETLKGLSLEKMIELRSQNKIKAISTSEFRKIEFKIFPFNKKMELDLHRPYIDEVKFYCPKCSRRKAQPSAKTSGYANGHMRIMERVPEVIDCWFDSGSMPFAQSHWPFAQNQKLKISPSQVFSENLGEQENQKYVPPELFPANYITEGIDQTRGWFYTLLAVSTLLGFGTPYKNVISLGLVLDEKGEKMSKSKGNIVNPWQIIEKYGSDAVRWYFLTVNQPGDSKLFSEKDIEESLRKFILTFWNCHLFYNTYAEQKSISVNQYLNQRKSGVLLDRWIVSKLNKLIRQVSESLEKYEVTFAARLIENFVIDDLSLWYIRRSRKRFQKPETKEELREASATLGPVLLTLTKLTAPFIPFLSEEIYQKISNFLARLASQGEAGGQFLISNSIHFEDWPKVNKRLIDKKLEKKMAEVRKIVTSALAERAKAKIKVRQPLPELRIKNYELRKYKELLELIKDEVNIKEITFGKTLKLDTRITPELREEGIIREIVRLIQEMRKMAGLKPKQRILVRYSGTSDLNKILEKNKTLILKEAKIKDLIYCPKEEEVFEAEKRVMIEGGKLWLRIKRI